MKRLKYAKQNNKGVAMIMVLCVMALFMAVCLSLVYAAGQLHAAVVTERLQFYCYQEALSYSEMLQVQLEDMEKASDFRIFVVGSFMDNSDDSVYPYPSSQEDGEKTLTHSFKGESIGDTGEDITIILTKEPNTAETNENDIETSDTNQIWQDKYKSDSILYVTVSIMKDGVESRVKTKYVYQAEYKVDYTLFEKTAEGSIESGSLLNQVVNEGENIEFKNSDNEIILNVAYNQAYEIAKGGYQNYISSKGKMYYIKCTRTDTATGDHYKFIQKGRERCNEISE